MTVRNNLIPSRFKGNIGNEKRTDVSKIFARTVGFFFFLMIILPTTFQLQRGIFLGGIILCAGIGGMYNKWRISKNIFILWLLTVSFGAFSIWLGYINGAPGAFRVSTVYIIWPLVYIIFIGLCHNPRTIIVFEKTLILGIWVSGLMLIILLVGALIGQGQLINIIFSFQGTNFGFYGGYIELTSYNMATLIYGLPFLITLFFSPNYQTLGIKRWSVAGAIIISLIICAVSGRRVFWLMFLVTPLIVWGLFFLARNEIHKKHFVIAIILLTIAVSFSSLFFHIEYSSIVEYFFLAFNIVSDDSATIRSQQFFSLMEQWSKSPLLGHGLGASVDTMIRSDEMSWAYELSYVALLFQVGILGVLIYTFSVIWIYYEGIKIVRARKDASPIILPFLAGLSGFLLVNATNPYLAKFDYLWTIFLPIAAINAYRTLK